MKIELWGSAFISGIVIQTSHIHDDRQVRSYYVQYSDDGITWSKVVEDGVDKVSVCKTIL